MYQRPNELDVARILVSAESRLASTTLVSTLFERLTRSGATSVVSTLPTSKPNFEFYQLRVYPTLVVVYHGKLTTLLNISWTQMELWSLQ